jgi:hypothetical protein
MTQTRENGPAQPKNLRETVSVLARLAPKQINDEVSLTVAQLKSKGLSLAVSVALVVVGLVFAGLLVIALVVAAIAGLATVMPLWPVPAPCAPRTRSRRRWRYPRPP